MVTWACDCEEKKRKRADCFCAIFIDFLSFDGTWGCVEMYKISEKTKAQGSITVEAAIVVSMILFCIFWFTEQGISCMKIR